MSNCIEIDNPEVTFTAAQLDIDRFMAVLDQHNVESNRNSTELEPVTCYWFLVPLRGFKPQDQRRRLGNVSFNGQDRTVTIHFGMGRSTHTNRDIAQTLAVLSKYLLQSVRLEYTYRDEYDGFQCKLRAKWDLVPGIWPKAVVK